MDFCRSIHLSAVALSLTVGPCLAGPCAKEISETQAAFDTKLAAAAASGPSAPAAARPMPTATVRLVKSQ